MARNLPALDPYAVLGVARDATRKEIDAAYKRHAKSTHPDKGGDPAAFHRVKLAYDILKDASRREKFDATGDASETTPPPNPDDGAINYINRLIATALGGDTDPFQYDLCAAIRDGLSKHASKTQGDINQLKTVIARATKMRKRFKRRSDGDNVLDGIVASHEQQSQLMLVKMTKQLADIQRATEIMTEYGFEKDCRSAYSADVFFTGQSSSAGGFFKSF